MTLKEARLLLQQFIRNATERKHPFLIINFSDEDDQYEVVLSCMDKLDAIATISEIAWKFKIKMRGIDLEAIREMIADLNRDEVIGKFSKN